MVTDHNEIKLLLGEYFQCHGDLQILDNGTVNVGGDVKLIKKTSHLPVQFGKVDGDFMCENNLLVSLEGSPQSVGGDFFCINNKLTSLKYSPIIVGGSFWCATNNLRNLEGAPQNVDDINCNHCGLVTLTGAPKTVRGNFACYSNRLISLEGAPDRIPGNFRCTNNKLVNLKGAPSWVGGRLWFYENPIISLDGAPEHVGEAVAVSYNQSLPLLRLITYPRIVFMEAPDSVQLIMNKYAGQGKKAALSCAADLIRAGFKDNAKW